MLEHIIESCKRSPSSTAACWFDINGKPVDSLTYAELLSAAVCLANRISHWKAENDAPIRIGLVAENSPQWVIADLALLISRAIEIPVPLAFSREQASNLLSNIDFFIVDNAGLNTLQRWGLTIAQDKTILLKTEELLRNRQDFNSLFNVKYSDDWICKIIHTSGTTSNPKGVKIRYHGISALLDSLLECIDSTQYSRYLSLVPLSLLIEQVTAVYMPLASNGQVMFLPHETPLLGTPGSMAKEYIDYIRLYKPSALTLTPALVNSLAAEAKNSSSKQQQLIKEIFNQAEAPFMACGGAPTDPELLKELYSKGIAIYEGYGLSENSSVVSWNRKGSFKPGTVGKPLPHVDVKISDEGELLITSSSLFAGYTNDEPSCCHLDDGWLHTGDLAEIDEEGFIRIIGRKKNIIITANGRNISPEWVESRYKTLSFVDNVVIFGDGLELIHGLFIINNADMMKSAEKLLRDYGKEKLSEIERVDQFHIYHVEQNDFSNLFTITGRPQRNKIWKKLNSKMYGGALC